MPRKVEHIVPRPLLGENYFLLSQGLLAGAACNSQPLQFRHLVSDPFAMGQNSAFLSENKDRIIQGHIIKLHHSLFWCDRIYMLYWEKPEIHFEFKTVTYGNIYKEVVILRFILQREYLSSL